MPALAFAVTPAVLTLLFGGPPDHLAFAPTSRSAVAELDLSARQVAADPLLWAPSALAGPIAGRPVTPPRPRRFIVIGGAAAGLARGGVTFLLPGPGPTPRRENPRITLRLGRHGAASALFDASF